MFGLVLGFRLDLGIFWILVWFGIGVGFGFVLGFELEFRFEVSVWVLDLKFVFLILI